MVRRLALIVACLVPACSTGAEQVDIAALAAEIPRLMEAADVPGLSIAVLEHGQISWTGAFGTVNDSATNAVNAETVFEAASLSKPPVDRGAAGGPGAADRPFSLDPRELRRSVSGATDQVAGRAPVL